MMEVHSQEYIVETTRRQNEGGILWFIERTDTNEFLWFNLRVFDRDFNRRENETYINWSKEAGVFPMTCAYLTKEDAEKNCPELTEGGCQHCGHNSKKIPTIVTEHEFIPNPPKIRTNTE